MPASIFPEADFQAALRRAGLDSLLPGDLEFLRGVFVRLAAPIALPPGFSITMPPATPELVNLDVEPEA